MAQAYWWRAVATGAHEVDNIREKLEAIPEQKDPATGIAAVHGSSDHE